MAEEGEIGQVVEQTEQGIRFRVDAVEPETNLLLVGAAEGIFQNQVGKSKAVLAFSHPGTTPFVAEGKRPLEAGQRIHPLIDAVHLAFARHYPLVLTPDVIWLTIAQGVSHHVNKEAGNLRSGFVSHSGKKRLTAVVRELSRPEHWRGAVTQWANLIGEQVVGEMQELLVCDFSTTTPDIRMASQVVLMETFKQYFDFMIACVCGIPEVTLRGTVEDWRAIRSRVERLNEFGLDWWTVNLSPICEEFVRTAEGKPTLAFWQGIYKPTGAYGGEIVTGWITDLFPYVVEKRSGKASQRNPLLQTPWHQRRLSSYPYSTGDGLSADVFPTGLSQVPFAIQMEDGQNELYCDLLAGCLGVRQNQGTLVLEPEIGWGVIESDDLQTLLEQIASDSRHHLNPRLEEGWEEGFWRFSFPGVSKEMIHLFDTCNGGTLFADRAAAIQIRPIDAVEVYSLEGIGEWQSQTTTNGRDENGEEFVETRIQFPLVIGMGDLPDGRIIGVLPASVTYSMPVKEIEQRWSEWPVYILQSRDAELPCRDEPNANKTCLPLQVVSWQMVGPSLYTFLKSLIEADGVLWFDGQSEKAHNE